MPHSRISDEKAETYVIYATVILKAFRKKNGQKMEDVKEYYIQHSAQDYFVKFCEGNVTQEELKKALSRHKVRSKVLKMEVVFKEGAWDYCKEDMAYAASRTGKYAVILGIFGKRK